MPKQTIGPEARIIQLFNELPDESRRIVLDIIRAQTIAPKPRKKAEPKAVAAKPMEIKDAGVCLMPDCNLPKDSPIHDPKGGYEGYHPFVWSTSARTARRRSSRKSDSSKAGGASAVSSEIDSAAVSAVAGG